MKNKKWICICLVIVILLSVILAGCGSNNGQQSTTDREIVTSEDKSDAANNAENASNSGVVGEDEELTWENADLSWRKDTSPVTFTTYIDYDWYPLDTWGNDDVSKEITKRTGVSLEVTKASDRTQLQVLLAADELPEIVFTDYLTQRFENSDISYPWDELIEEYCPEFMRLIDPVEIINNTIEDGHFYTLKSHYNNDTDWEDPRNLPSPGDPGLYIREDIMEELGNPKLDSVEDLLDVFKMVKENYPDMIVYIPHPTWTNPIMEFMGLTKGFYVTDDGNVKLGISNPEFEEFYLFFNKLYREGYVSQEAFTYKPEQFFQIVRSGNVFAASYNAGLADETNKIYDDNNIKGKFVPITKVLTYKGEERLQPVYASIGWSSTFITRKNKNPDRAIRYMEFLKSPEGDQLTQWGIEGKHYTLTEEGLIKRPEGFSELTVQDHGIGPWYFMASGLGEGVAVSSAKISNLEYSSSVDLLRFRKQYYKRDPALYFARPLAETEEFNINVKINDLITNTEVSIITAPSEEEASARYRKMIEDAKTIGLEKLEEYATKAYKEARARYDK